MTIYVEPGRMESDNRNTKQLRIEKIVKCYSFLGHRHTADYNVDITRALFVTYKLFIVIRMLHFPMKTIHQRNAV